MDYLGKGAPLMFGRVAHFQSVNHHQSISSDLRSSIERLFYVTKLAVDARDQKLTRKCFVLANALLHHGSQQIRLLTQVCFVNAFRQTLSGGDQDEANLRRFVPSDFYNLFVNGKPNLDQQSTAGSEAVYQEEIVYRLASEEDHVYAEAICRQMHDSAIARRCGISKREPAELIEKMKNGKAIIAINSRSEWVGFSYIEVYENGGYVSNSGLIVSPEYRKHGVAWEIKQRIFDLSRTLYPTAKIFSITSGGAVMKMNSKFGFEPVPYAEITNDPKFWEGCKSCVNHAALLSKNCQNCFCTAMLFCPNTKSEI